MRRLLLCASTSTMKECSALLQKTLLLMKNGETLCKKARAMKKNLVLCAVAAVVLSACAKEIVPENSGFQNLKTVTFEADASSQTRTTLVDGTKVYWCAGDQIYVKGAPEAFTNALEGEETAARAAFTGDVEPADVYYAVYPYVESWEDNSARTKIPVIQQAANGTFGNGYNITAAKTTSQDMTFGFKNVLGYIKFTSNLPEGSISSVIVSTNAGEKISGNIMIDVEADVPVAEALDAKAYTALSFDNALAEGEYYIAMIPGEYTQGLTIDFVASDGYVSTVYVDYPITLKAGHINPIGTLDNLTWYDPSEGSENSVWKGKFVTGDEGQMVCKDLAGDKFDWYSVTPGDTLRIYGYTSEYRPETWSMSLVGISSGKALDVLPEKYEKAETVSIELTQEVLDEICLNEGLGITGIDYCFTNIEIIPAVVEEPEDPIEPEEGVTVIWKGKFDTGAWSGGITDLANGGYDWSQHKPGDIIKFYGGPTDPTAENSVFSLRLGDDWARFLSGVPQYITMQGEYSVTLSQVMIDELVDNNGLIIQGDNCTLTRIEIIEGTDEGGDEGEAEEAALLWEGEFLISGWNGFDSLSWSGYDWSSCQPGNVLKITGTVPAADWWCLSLRVGADWSGLNGVPAQYEKPGIIYIELTQEIIDDLVARGGLIIQGDGGYTLTKIELYEEMPDELVLWEGAYECGTNYSGALQVTLGDVPYGAVLNIGYETPAGVGDGYYQIKLNYVGSDWSWNALGSTEADVNEWGFIPLGVNTEKYSVALTDSDVDAINAGKKAIIVQGYAATITNVSLTIE